ncbi:MAG: CinA family protein, partial [Clostridiales bacterium]|nr:CinA family protein [Clostridiales bacterium]
MNSENQLVQLLKEKQLTVTTAESITGGMIASTIIKVPGASSVFSEGFITYSADAKIKYLEVP